MVSLKWQCMKRTFVLHDRPQNITKVVLSSLQLICSTRMYCSPISASAIPSLIWHCQALSHWLLTCRRECECECDETNAFICPWLSFAFAFYQTDQCSLVSEMIKLFHCFGVKRIKVDTVFCAWSVACVVEYYYKKGVVFCNTCKWGIKSMGHKN